MDSNTADNEDSVTVSMELSGTYDDVVTKLQSSETKNSELQDIVADFEILLDTVDAIDGGTKSVILEHLPADTTVEYDSEAVVTALQVMEAYDLVTLEGNTWMLSD